MALPLDWHVFVAFFFKNKNHFLKYTSRIQDYSKKFMNELLLNLDEIVNRRNCNKTAKLRDLKKAAKEIILKSLLEDRDIVFR